MPTVTMFPHDVYTNDFLRRTYGPVIRRLAQPIPRDFVHPEEHRCRSLIRSRRDAMHFLMDQLTYDIQSADSTRIAFYIHNHAVGICELIAQIRIIRTQVALGIPVNVKELR